MQQSSSQAYFGRIKETIFLYIEKQGRIRRKTKKGKIQKTGKRGVELEERLHKKGKNPENREEGGGGEFSSTLKNREELEERIHKKGKNPLKQGRGGKEFCWLTRIYTPGSSSSSTSKDA